MSGSYAMWAPSAPGARVLRRTLTNAAVRREDATGEPASHPLVAAASHPLVAAASHTLVAAASHSPDRCREPHPDRCHWTDVVEQIS